MHYDGQPSNPADWTRGAPFAPAAFNGKTAIDLAAGTGPVDPDVRIYGRSTSDDKGPIVAFLAALDGVIAAKADLAWNIRIVLEGEEEAGSPNFDATMARHADDVKSDLAIVVDSPRHPSGLPTVFYGSRGGVTATVKVYGATGDLHSGNYGNFVTDPTMALARLLASMKDARGNVTIRNFYDDVAPLTEVERRAIDEIPNVDRQLLDAVRPGSIRTSRKPHRNPAQPADAQHHGHRVGRRIYRHTIRDSRFGVGPHRDAAGKGTERGPAAGTPGCPHPGPGLPRDRDRP